MCLLFSLLTNISSHGFVIMTKNPLVKPLELVQRIESSIGSLHKVGEWNFLRALEKDISRDSQEENDFSPTL